MPENRKTQQSNNNNNNSNSCNHSNNVVSTSNPSVDSVEEGMRQMKIQTQQQQDGGERGGGIGVIGIVHPNPYPDRPGEPDCLYYLRTGLCGYGNTCRFNHPAGKGAQYKGELPERVGQSECQYFLKTGTCKFGASCKFHHPRDKHIAGQVLLNILGLPMRQDEKSCPYYMRTWSCKFGASCKFHHPQPSGVATLPIAGAPASAANQTGLSYVGGLPTWPLSRTPSNPALQGPQAYMPVVLSSSQGILPAQNGWNTYMGESGSSGQMNVLSGYPERPDQPECQYYMKTGTCKFGAQCKYHHPKERMAPLFTTTSSIGPFGLPLRPGQAICTFYSMYGICKFGTSCKFDHPLAEFYSYGVSMAGLSMSDSSAIPNMEHSPVSQSSETSSPSKSVVLPDRTKDDVTSSKHQNSDKEVLEDKPRDATSPPRSTTPDGPCDPID